MIRMLTLMALVAGMLVPRVTRAEAPASVTAHHIAGPSRPIAPGSTVELHLAPPYRGAPRRVAWFVVTGPGVASRDGYAAPYIVSPGATLVTLRVVAKNDIGELETLAEETLRLVEGTVPGAESCLGPGQIWAKGGRDFDQTLSTDDIAEVLVPAEPGYPAAARARGIEGIVPVHALVCRTGRVLDAWIPPTDPPHPELAILHEAALEAAHRFVWRAPTVSGQPVAFHALIPFRFPPP